MIYAEDYVEFFKAWLGPLRASGSFDSFSQFHIADVTVVDNGNPS
jgi:hypothetical protein